MRLAKGRAQSAPPRGRTPNYKKKPIPSAVRQQSWVRAFGLEEKKCSVTWCTNTITPFDFHCGHNIPESKGGKTVVENLIPICSRCNQSMSDTYTFQEWCTQFSSATAPQPQAQAQPRWWRFFCWT